MSASALKWAMALYFICFWPMNMGRYPSTSEMKENSKSEHILSWIRILKWQKKQHRINLGVYSNLCSKLQAKLYLWGIRMKNEMMQDYSLPCTIVRYHIQASVLFSLKKAELQGAAPRPLSCAGSSPCSTASFLRAGYSTTQVNMCSPFQELISWFKKITSPLSGGKSLQVSHFIGQKGEVPQRPMQSKNPNPELWIAAWRWFF